VLFRLINITDESDILSIEQLEKILPHAALLLSYDAIKSEQAIDLANYLCKQYWKHARFKQAEKHGRKAVAISERHFVPGHPRVASSQSNLGEVLRNLGELEEARDLLRKALESDAKSFEPGHPKIAIRQSNLAVVLQNLGKLEEALTLAGRAYSSLLDKLGPEHPYTKTAKINWECLSKKEL
jgi:tetratricopeptide (TPR) repeat protein